MGSWNALGGRPMGWRVCVLAVVLTAACGIGPAIAQDSPVDREDVIRAVDGHVEHNTSPEPQQAVFVGLPKAIESQDGSLLVLPNAVASSDATSTPQGGQGAFSTRESAVFSGRGQLPLIQSPYGYARDSEPVGSSVVTGADQWGSVPLHGRTYAPIFDRISPRPHRLRNGLGYLVEKILGCDASPGGVGRERLPYSLFVLDSTAPSSNTRIRFNTIFHRTEPDRAEYYWAKIGGLGPSEPERAVDSQEMRISFEAGGDMFSLTTEVPFIESNPDINGNTVGLGDMTVTTKTVLKDTNRVQVSQIFRSYFNTGSASRGTGNGHVSFEPGIAFRHKFRPQTEFQGELLYFFPVGSDPEHSGQVLKWGLGAVHVWYDSDDYAVLPSLELTGWSVLDGFETRPGGEVVSADSFHAFALTPGCHFVFDNAGDLGLFDAGIGVTLPLSADRFQEAALMFEMRWTY